MKRAVNLAGHDMCALRKSFLCCQMGEEVARLSLLQARLAHEFCEQLRRPEAAVIFGLNSS